MKSIALQLEKIRKNIPTIGPEPVRTDLKPVTLGGYLRYNSSRDGWDDSICLVDGGMPETAGWMPLVMDDLKQFDGKDVVITVRLAQGEDHV